MTALLNERDQLATADVRLEATTRHWRQVDLLLERRKELRGVCAMADLIREAVRWAA